MLGSRRRRGRVGLGPISRFLGGKMCADLNAFFFLRRKEDFELMRMVRWGLGVMLGI